MEAAQKFKVGDEVRVVAKGDRFGWNSEMDACVGDGATYKVLAHRLGGTILDGVGTSGQLAFYGGWIWPDECLELAQEQEQEYPQMPNGADGNPLQAGRWYWYQYTNPKYVDDAHWEQVTGQAGDISVHVLTTEYRKDLEPCVSTATQLHPEPPNAGFPACPDESCSHSHCMLIGARNGSRITIAAAKPEPQLERRQEQRHGGQNTVDTIKGLARAILHGHVSGWCILDAGLEVGGDVWLELGPGAARAQATVTVCAEGVDPQLMATPLRFEIEDAWAEFQRTKDVWAKIQRRQQLKPEPRPRTLEEIHNATTITPEEHRRKFAMPQKNVCRYHSHTEAGRSGVRDLAFVSDCNGCGFREGGSCEHPQRQLGCNLVQMFVGLNKGRPGFCPLLAKGGQ